MIKLFLILVILPALCVSLRGRGNYRILCGREHCLVRILVMSSFLTIVSGTPHAD